jgi:hypothetical protein
MAEEAHVPAAVPEPPPAGVEALGDYLVWIHGRLRKDLDDAREQLADLARGRAAAGTEEPAPSLTQQLRDHCRSVCGDLDSHHTGEDTQGFPLLERQFPELAPAIERLRAEHVEVARLSGDLQAVLADGDAGDLARVRADFERLASELEAHFAREEEQLVEAGNKIPLPPGG